MREWVRFDGQDGHIICDARHWPVVIATWIGNTDIESVRNYFAWNTEVIDKARGTKGYVIITDADRAARPAPDVRRLISQLTDAMPAGSTERNIGNYIVITSALVRGALTAMQWISRDKWSTIQVGSMAEAISRAFIDVDKAGLRRPTTLSPSDYRAERKPG